MNKKKKITAIIQARMNSSRLPGKVLKDIVGKPMLWHIINRVKKSKYILDWEKQGSKKVVLGCKDEKEMEKYLILATEKKLPKALISDAGRTELPPGTKTALAIGPAPSEKIDSITQDLKLL